MPQESNGCNYDYHWWFGKKCPHPVYADGLCIFHLPKLSAEAKAKLEPGSKEEKQNDEFEELFREEFYQELKRQHADPGVKEIDFIGFRFPDIDLSSLKLFDLLEHQELQKPVYFSLSSFQKVNFNCVDFLDVEFAFAEIREADFSNASFRSAIFAGAQIQSAYFIETDFKVVNFNGVAVSEVIVFHSLFRENYFHDRADFSCMVFRDKGMVIFERVDLSKALFYGTSLLEGENTRVEFNDVYWGRKSILGRQVLQDEFEETTKEFFLERYQSISDLYHQLVKIYEAKREFETAEDFHIGEMEMRRKRIWAAAKPWCRWHRRWTNSYFLYKILSNYGTSYWHALVVLCLMLLGFGVFSLLSGFSVDGYPVEYNLSPHWQITWTDVWSALGYALSALPLKHDAVYKASAPWLEIVKGLASLVLSGQLALTLLAVRRRFKR